MIMPTTIRRARIDLPAQERTTDHNHHTGTDTTGQQSQTGLCRSKVQNGLREQREQVNTTVETEAEHQEQQQRSTELFVFQYLEADNGRRIFRR